MTGKSISIDSLLCLCCRSCQGQDTSQETSADATLQDPNTSAGKAHSLHSRKAALDLPERCNIRFCTTEAKPFSFYVRHSRLREECHERAWKEVLFFGLLFEMYKHEIDMMAVTGTEFMFIIAEGYFCFDYYTDHEHSILFHIYHQSGTAIIMTDSVHQLGPRLSYSDLNSRPATLKIEFDGLTVVISQDIQDLLPYTDDPNPVVIILGSKANRDQLFVSQGQFSRFTSRNHDVLCRNTYPNIEEFVTFFFGWLYPVNLQLMITGQPAALLSNIEYNFADNMQILKPIGDGTVKAKLHAVLNQEGYFAGRKSLKTCFDIINDIWGERKENQRLNISLNPNKQLVTKCDHTFCDHVT